MSYRNCGFTVAAVILVFVPFIQSYGQSFPAGVQGTWKIVKKLNVPYGQFAIGGILPNPEMGTTITIGNRSFEWKMQHWSDAHPRVLIMSPSQFHDAYIGSSLAKRRNFGLLDNSKVEVIRIGDPEFGAGGDYYQAVHSGGFQVPELPDK